MHRFPHWPLRPRRRPKVYAVLLSLAAVTGLLTATLTAPALADTSPDPSPSTPSASSSPSSAPSTTPSSSPSTSASPGTSTAPSSDPSAGNLEVEVVFGPWMAYEGQVVTIVTSVVANPDHLTGTVSIPITHTGPLTYIGPGPDTHGCVTASPPDHVTCPLPSAINTLSQVRFRVGKITGGDLITYATNVTVTASDGETFTRHPGIKLAVSHVPGSPSPSTAWSYLHGTYKPSTAAPGDTVALTVSSQHTIVGGSIDISGSRWLIYQKCWPVAGGGYCGPNKFGPPYFRCTPDDENSPGILCTFYFRVASNAPAQISQNLILEDDEIIAARSTAYLTIRRHGGSSVPPVSPVSSNGDLPVTGASLPLYAGLAATLLTGGAALILLARRRTRRAR